MARPRKYPAANDPLLLSAALEGLELQRARIEAQIKAVKAMLGKGGGGSAAPASAPAASKSRVKRELSDEARKRIAAAQKKRWAEFRRNKANS